MKPGRLGWLALSFVGGWTAAMPDRPVIAVAHVGEAPVEIFGILAPALRDAFGCDVVTAPDVSLPSSAYDPRRRQHLSTAVLDLLARVKRTEWDRLLGVADVDLYVPELNFVFGEGDPARGVAVFSLHRLRPPRGQPGEEDLFARRAATEAIHELGHSYGLRHCRDAGCVMWFSNTLAESDRKGTAFCRAHRAELARALGP